MLGQGQKLAGPRRQTSRDIPTLIIHNIDFHLNSRTVILRICLPHEVRRPSGTATPVRIYGRHDISPASIWRR
jgi:hypothetical protein